MSLKGENNCRIKIHTGNNKQKLPPEYFLTTRDSAMVCNVFSYDIFNDLFAKSKTKCIQ